MEKKNDGEVHLVSIKQLVGIICYFLAVLWFCTEKNACDVQLNKWNKIVNLWETENRCNRK